MKNYIKEVHISIASKLQKDLEEQGFELSTPPYTIFSAKKKNLSCTLYQSGKLMVQGKDMDEFIEFYLEPEILKEFNHTYQNLNLDPTPRIGIDESGKGDFFGPLCIAGVYAEGEQIKALKDMGVQDSKKISDGNILKLGVMIKNNFVHHIVKINPSKYNDIHTQFGNLNLLLAWGHATTIEHLVEKTQCKNVIIDQFASEYVVLNALKKKNMSIQLTQRHRAEEDLIVAAASILARFTFLKGLEYMEQKYQMKFPKGASPQTIEAGKYFVGKFGKDQLGEVAKLHFKTLDRILK